MATSVKSKFAGLLRGLLRQLDDRAPMPTPPVAAPLVLPVATPAAQFSTPPPVTTDGIQLPLAPVVASLPLDLRAKLMAVPAGTTICLPLETVISQLAFGAVKISFGELRQLAPGVFANSGGEHDHRPVNLPLHEILARLNPALLARRPVQKTEVAGDIAGPFDGRGRGITFTTHPLKTAPAAPMIPTPAPEPAPARLPVSSPPIAFNPPLRPVMPTVPLTFPPRESAPTAFTPPPKPVSNGNGNGHAVPALGIKFTAAPVPSPVPPAARPEPAPPATSGPAIFVSLGDLAETWPEELRNEITRSNLADVSVPLAAALVEPGLKRGRVTMTWKQLRTLARPSSAPSPNDGLELDLSLKVLAPIFLDAQKNLLRPNRKVAVSADIPNLFFGFPQPAETPVPTAAAPKPKAADTNYYVWGENGEAPKTDEAELRRVENPATDFLSRQAHPKTIVVRATALPGVAGAVVALPDGLRVASEVPAELNGDTLAAFLPQIFERVNQSTRELRMGALNNVSFTVGNVPWKIFRVNSVYFAAFGHAGESLPTAQLAQLATDLDRKKSQ